MCLKTVDQLDKTKTKQEKFNFQMKNGTFYDGLNYLPVAVIRSYYVIFSACSLFVERKRKQLQKQGLMLFNVFVWLETLLINRSCCLSSLSVTGYSRNLFSAKLFNK